EKHKQSQVNNRRIRETGNVKDEAPWDTCRPIGQGQARSKTIRDRCGLDVDEN
ncbi:hypothetical protein SARC_16206, partial [Sphaeroforma arctica JP610]